MGAALALTILGCSPALAAIGSCSLDSRAPTELAAPAPELQDPDKPDPPTRKDSGDKPRLAPLPALAPIAGLNGFEAISTLTSPTATDPPHKLVAAYVFPDRVSLNLSASKGKLIERQLHLRYGEHVFVMKPRSSTSQELRDADRNDVLRQMELRRALMLWPDGFEWKGAGAERGADLGSMGSLRARYADTADKRPIEIASLDTAGQVIDAFKALTWRVTKGRTWFDAGEYWLADKLVWTEKIESIDTSKTFIDYFFLPTDLRDTTTAHDVMAGRVQPLDLPSFCARRFALDTGVTWEGALSELEKLRAEWTKRLETTGLKLDSKATFEVSNDVRPVACLLRLATIPEPIPEGFAITPVRTSRAMYVHGRDEATPARLKTLSEALPKDARTSAPYLRFDPAERERSLVLIVLPIATAD